MDQLIQEIAQRTGISNEQAKMAVDHVVAFLKTKLPAPLAGQVDAALSGQGAGNLAEQAKGMLGGLMGGQG